MELTSPEATKFVWDGAIPLQIRLHESEVTTLPLPPPIMILGPRIGFLPLLVPLIKPHFSSTLPPGVDTVWFDYKGLPLKWYIPTGVLFDLLCAEPERPWDLTVHFRGYPGEILTPCEGEDNVKWSFINTLKEAAYIINGNCKNVMNMSQADQFELWQSMVNVNMDGYLRVSSRLKLGPVDEDCMVKVASSTGDSDSAAPTRSCRIPVRLYVRSVGEDIEDIEDATPIDSWDRISYINRPVEIQREEGCNITLESAIKNLLPEFFEDEPTDRVREDANEAVSGLVDSETTSTIRNDLVKEDSDTSQASQASQAEAQLGKKATVKLIRIQGVELDSQIPFSWVINNLKNPEYFLHICIFVTSSVPPRAR